LLIDKYNYYLIRFSDVHMIKEEFISIFSKKYVKDYFIRNRNLILLGIIIFIISIIVGYVYNDVFRNIMLEAMKNMNIPLDNPIDSTVALFLNNIRVNLLMILLGFTFSVISVMVLFVNGILIGFITSIVPGHIIFLYTFPHGIFEIPALFLAMLGSFIVTKFEIKILKGIFQNGKTFKGELHDSRLMIKDIILTIILVTVLLCIAAIIEANFTLTIGNFIMSLL